MKNITKIYFTLVSLVSVVGLAIALGVTLYSFASSRIISDDEFIASRATYEYQACEQPDYSKVIDSTKDKPLVRTAEQIATCKTDKKAELLTQRHFETKQSLIGGISWACVALILFLFHYPMMIKKSHEDA